MKKLEINFAQKQHLKINDLMDSTGAKKSQVARAAMQIGLQVICESGKGAADKIAINDLKALN